MNPEEVIERLKTIFAFGISNCIADKIARDTTFAALEKQIPKKVTFRSEYLCGNCNVTINSEDCYCYNCGQRQDWSEE